MAGDERETTWIRGEVDVTSDGQVEAELRELREQIVELNRTLGYVGNVISQSVDGLVEALRHVAPVVIAR